MKKQIKLLTVLVTLSLLTIGVFSSFKSNESRSLSIDTRYLTESGEDTTGSGSGSGEEFYGKTLTNVPCSVEVTCPNGSHVTRNGFSMQCGSNSGYCHPSTEAGCDAEEPNCP